jgi:AcrR family transcriptional regulator
MVNKDAIRKEIVEKSKEVFTKFGYQKSNLDEISVIVGKKKSSLYYYFESKEDIFRALIDHESNLLYKELCKQVKNQTDPIEKVRTFITFRYKRLTEIANEYNAIKNDFLDYIHLVYSVREKYDAMEIDLFEQILSEGADAEIFKVTNTNLSAKAIFMAIKGIQMPFIISPIPIDIDKRVKEIINLIFYGIIK